MLNNIISLFNWILNLLNVKVQCYLSNQTLINKKNIRPEKIILIPNAADFSLSEELLLTFDAKGFRQKHQMDDKFVITYVGAHGVANHLDQILEAGKHLEDTNVLFLLIGDGMEKERLIKLAKSKAINNVRFIDSVPKAEVFKYILASDIGASVLKKVDTFKTVYSNKTFDYMACKKPILMAIDGVSRQLVEEAEAGVYVEPENPIDFEIKIRSYLNNRALISKHGENGYNYAKSNFDRKVLANNYLNHLKTLVNV